VLLIELILLVEMIVNDDETEKLQDMAAVTKVVTVCKLVVTVV